jgi:group I intron endonuclease
MEQINRYSKGKIYRLICENEEYIGSTCDTLSKRLHRHKNEAKRTGSKVYRHINDKGWDNANMVLLEEYPCNSKLELERRERYWIEERLPSLNTNVPTRTIQEYRKVNAEKTKEYFKTYYEENKQSIQENNKAYREEHKGQIATNQKSYREDNKERLNASNKAYYSLNKDLLLKQQKTYYESNKAVISLKVQREITCECGCKVQRCNLARHLKSPKHQVGIKGSNA